MRRLLLITLIFILTTSLQASDTNTYKLKTIDNKNITVSETKISETESGLDFHEFRGKSIFLSLFGHKCRPCIKEIPEFIDITEEHKDDIEIVTIESQGQSLNELKEFADLYDMNYNVIAGTEHKKFFNYITDKLPYKRGIPLPLLIAIDKNGVIQQVRAGYIKKSELKDLIKELKKIK